MVLNSAWVVSLKAGMGNVEKGRMARMSGSDEDKKRSKTKQEEGEQDDERVLSPPGPETVHVCLEKTQRRRVTLRFRARRRLFQVWGGCMNLSGVVNVVGVRADNDTTVGAEVGHRKERSVFSVPGASKITLHYPRVHLHPNITPFTECR